MDSCRPQYGMLPESRHLARKMMAVGVVVQTTPFCGRAYSTSRSMPTTMASIRTGTTRPHPGQISGRLRLPVSSPTTEPSHRRHVEQPGVGRSTASTFPSRVPIPLTLVHPRAS